VVKQVRVIIDGDINRIDEDKLTEMLTAGFEREGYLPADKPVVVREGKVSSIRAVELDTQEEVEIYALAQVFKKDGKVKTVITGRVV